MGCGAGALDGPLVGASVAIGVGLSVGVDLSVGKADDLSVERWFSRG